MEDYGVPSSTTTPFTSPSGSTLPSLAIKASSHSGKGVASSSAAASSWRFWRVQSLASRASSRVTGWKSRISQLTSATPVSTAWRQRFNNCTQVEDPELLRSVPAVHVLRGFGNILRDSGGTAETYALSHSVDRIGTFISHNWSTPWRPKFAVLALHFNLRVALTFTVLISVPLVICSASGWLPLLEMEVEGGPTYRCMYCLVGGTLTFWLALFFGAEVPALVGQGPQVFLDKVCINQTDAEEKRKGIASLAAFIGNSDQFLIVYAETYLRKLWTVYELATTLILHPGQAVEFMPLIIPKIVCMSNIIWFLFSLFHLLASLRSVQQELTRLGLAGLLEFIITAAILYPSTFALSMALRMLIRLQKGIEGHVKDFALANANCFDEADRAVVQNNVVAFMRHMRYVPPQASDATARGIFDLLVTQQLPRTLASSFGRAGVPYRYVMAIFISQILRWFDEIAMNIYHQDGLRLTLTNGLAYITIYFAINPLGFRLIYGVMVFQLQLHGALESVFIGLSCIGMCAIATGVWFILLIAERSARETTVGLIVLICYSGLLFAVTFVLYRPVRHVNSDFDQSDEHAGPIPLGVTPEVDSNSDAVNSSATHHDDATPGGSSCDSSVLRSRPSGRVIGAPSSALDPAR